MTDDSLKSGSHSNQFSSSLPLYLLAFAAQGFFCAGGAPDIQIKPAMSAIGMRTPVTIEISEPRRGLTTRQSGTGSGQQIRDSRRKKLCAQLPVHFLGFQDREGCAEDRDGPQDPARLTGGSAAIRITAGRAGTWLRHPAPVSRRSQPSGQTHSPFPADHVHKDLCGPGRM